MSINTVPDGADQAQGNTADPAWSGSGAGTVIALLKKLVASIGGATAPFQDNTAFTPGTTTGMPIMAEVDDVGTTTTTENNAGAVRMNTNRSLHVTLRNASTAGVDYGTGAAGTLTTLRVVTATNSTIGTVSTVIPGTGATNLGKAQGAIPAAGDTGVMILTSDAVTGQYEALASIGGGVIQTALVDGNSGAGVFVTAVDASAAAPGVVVGGFVDAGTTPAVGNGFIIGKYTVNHSAVGVIEDGTTNGRYATVTASNALKIDGSAVTQPVSVASLPLPTNAAQETGGNLATLAATVANSKVQVSQDDLPQIRMYAKQQAELAYAATQMFGGAGFYPMSQPTIGA